MWVTRPDEGCSWVGDKVCPDNTYLNLVSIQIGPMVPQRVFPVMRSQYWSRYWLPVENAIWRVCKIQFGEMLIIILAEGNRLRGERLTYHGYGNQSQLLSFTISQSEPNFHKLADLWFLLVRPKGHYRHVLLALENQRELLLHTVSDIRSLASSVQTIRTNWDACGTLGLNAAALAVCNRMVRSLWTQGEVVGGVGV